VVPEQRDQQNDRNWHAEQPKQNASTKSHVDLQLVEAMNDVLVIRGTKKGSMAAPDTRRYARFAATAANRLC
jgi:hypothetical protein